MCLALLFAFLLWVPLPFASTPDEFQLPLVAGATAICAATAICLALSKGRLAFSDAYRAWSIGAVVFMLLVALQLVPVPMSLLHLASPESARIWANADRVASLIVTPTSSAHPITIDPQTTRLHLFRLLAYFATFTASALLIRRHAPRVALAVALGCSMLFQTFYGLREAYLHRFAIWGWKNTLIFDRVTGTFVNPNHFAHYAAIVAPFGALLLATAWHDASPQSARHWRRIVKVLERRAVPAAFGALVVLACIVAVLVSKSRGALLALFAGAAVGLAAITGRRIIRTLLFLAAVVTAVALYLGSARTTMSRLPTEEEARALGGRRTGLETALSIWRRYPVFGSGLGTFGDVAPMAQPDAFDRLYTHAHDDYAEIAATTGAVGIVVFLVALTMGVIRFARTALSPQRSWRRLAFHAAAFTSIAIALTHALIDFNFFIPANAVTIAAIAGAAVATRLESGVIPGSALEDSQA